MSSINSKIEKNKDFLRFIAFAASTDQAEDVLYEIQPNQLESLRSILKLLRRKGKIQKVIDNFVSKEVTSGGNVRRTKKWEKLSAKCNIFFLKLETQAASRVMLKKNAALIVQIVQKGLNLWDVKSNQISNNFEKQQLSLTNNHGFEEKISGKKRSKEEEDEERNDRKKISKNEKAAVDEKKLGKNADSSSEDNEQEERESSTGSGSIAESSETEEEEEQQQRRQEFSAETGRKQKKSKNFFFPRERSNYSSSD